MQEHRKNTTDKTKTHVYKPGVTLVPCHRQLGVRGVSAVDATFRQPQIQGTVPDVVAQKKIPLDCHGDGSNPALNWEGPWYGAGPVCRSGIRRQAGDGVRSGRGATLRSDTLESWSYNSWDFSSVWCWYDRCSRGNHLAWSDNGFGFFQRWCLHDINFCARQDPVVIKWNHGPWFTLSRSEALPWQARPGLSGLLSLYPSKHVHV